MSKEKQIDEIAKLICNFPQCINYNSIGECKPTECQIADKAEALYNAGYRKQSESFSRPHENDGEWKSKHHMSRSPRGRYTSYNTYSCNVCGKANGRRKTPFCPNCGAKMKGGE